MLGVSVDSRFTQKAWAEKLGLNFPLLSDFPNREVSQAYGVYVPKRGAARRVTFLVDKEGIIRHKVSSRFEVARDHREALEILKTI